ncbi:acyl carrier protein [Kitasatospora sp. NPDC058048]|uniref:acyl carrier protein n=1 Tax=Kitasatospora sp. NPDC058048 TaxID=3346313 RepID=UPI0036DBD1AB
MRKPLRPALTKRYGERFEALYTELSDREAEEGRTLRRTGADQPVPATVFRAAQALLGLEEGAVEPGTRFLELGGDSLTALSFSRLVKEIFHVDVPVDVIISPVDLLQRVADHIERALAAEHRRPTADSVHGPDATRPSTAATRNSSPRRGRGGRGTKRQGLRIEGLSGLRAIRLPWWVQRSNRNARCEAAGTGNGASATAPAPGPTQASRTAKFPRGLSRRS